LEEVIRTYATRLDRARYELAVAYRVGGVVASEIGALSGVYAFCYDAPRRRQRLLSLWRFARTFKPHIVHNHFSWYGLIVGLLVGARRVETIHNTYHWFPPVQRVLYSLYCLLASRIIAVSDHVRVFSQARFPLLRLRDLRVVHNGIVTERFESSDAHSVRQELGIPSSNPVIGFIGRLEEQKGVTHLLQAVAELKNQFQNIRLVIAGDGTLKEQLRREAVSLGLNDVLFLGFRRDTPQLLRAFDVFVLPSLFEGLPVALIEAMAAGCAVVASRIGGVEELLTDGVTGLLVAPGSSPALAEALRRLIVQPDLRHRLGRQAQQHVTKEFSAEAMIAGTEEVYRRLVPHLFAR
jgi:glycosyltransferase involved in cell wall biosynthesis